MKIHSVGFISAVIYTTAAVTASGVFLTITLDGDYDWTARVGGALWVFLLSMIVLMPLVMTLVKKKYRNKLR